MKPANELRKPTSSTTKQAAVFSGILLTVFLFALIRAELGGARPSTQADYSLDARNVCKDFVLDQLVAPATAKFQNVYQMSVNRVSELEFLVNGHVDAQNRLGARVRSTFACHVQRAQNRDAWIPISVQLEER